MGGIADIDTKLCVAEDSFKYHLNGNINLPCQSGYFPIKAALYLEPMTRECHQWPGQPMYCSGGIYDFHFQMDDDSRAVAAGPFNWKGGAPAKHRDNNKKTPEGAAGVARVGVVGGG